MKKPKSKIKRSYHDLFINLVFGDGAAQNKRFLCWLSHCKVQQLGPAGDVSQTSLPIQDCKFPS